MYKTHDEALQELRNRNYVPTPEEQEQIKAHEEKAEWWRKRGNEALWDTDGFSLTAFVSGPAAEDEEKQAERIRNGGLGVFRVFVRLADDVIVIEKPEAVQNPVAHWRYDMKWIIRDERGRMQRGEDGRWLVFPLAPKRESTHSKRGYAERWCILPYTLVKLDESIGSAMKRGTARSQLDRKIVKPKREGSIHESS